MSILYGKNLIGTVIPAISLTSRMREKKLGYKLLLPVPQWHIIKYLLILIPVTKRNRFTLPTLNICVARK